MHSVETKFQKRFSKMYSQKHIFPQNIPRYKALIVQSSLSYWLCLGDICKLNRKGVLVNLFWHILLSTDKEIGELHCECPHNKGSDGLILPFSLNKEQSGYLNGIQSFPLFTVYKWLFCDVYMNILHFIFHQVVAQQRDKDDPRLWVL